MAVGRWKGTRDLHATGRKIGRRRHEESLERARRYLASEQGLIAPLDDEGHAAFALGDTAP